MLSVGFLNELLDHLAPVAVLAAVRRPDGAVEDFAWRFANHAASVALGVDGDSLIHTTLRRTADGVDVRSDTDAVIDACRRVVDSGVDTSVHLPWPADATPFGAPVRVHRLGDGVLLEWAAVLDEPADGRRTHRLRPSTEGSTPLAGVPLDLVLDGVDAGILHVDSDRRVRFSNRRVAEMIADGAALTAGHSLDDLELPGPFRSRWERALQVAAEAGERVVFDHTAPGDIARHVELAVAPVTADSPMLGTVTTIRDITDHVRREQTLVTLARRDPLTGLDNRSEVSHELERALAAAVRSGRPVGLLSVDLDGFKFVNDSFGHHIGDELLRAAADRLRTAVRSGDLLSRTGGDEFVVVCRDLRRADDALRSAWRIVEAFRDPFPVDDVEIVTTASVGVAVSSGHDTVDDVVEQADAAVYAAKAAGRDTVATFDAVLQAEVDRRHQIEVDLRAAIGRGGVGPGGAGPG
ncbi:MAG: diguanylate cyclase, partial [Acidobacteria bacterium]|nr:diguanylate cyclase [Acidobacteriota bacterium]